MGPSLPLAHPVATSRINGNSSGSCAWCNHGFDLQQGIDAPLFHSKHFQASFYPRAAAPGEMMIEETIGQHVIEALRSRGHEVDVAQANSVGRLNRRQAASRWPDSGRRHPSFDAGLCYRSVTRSAPSMNFWCP